MFSKSVGAAVAAAVVTLSACGTTQTSQEEMAQRQTAAPSQNIVEVAVANGSFNTLVAAVKAAGLAETLAGPGPFTVFAPTDAAFATLPAGTIDMLLADKAKLSSILTYHVLAGKVGASDVTNGAKPATVNGQQLEITTSGGKVYVNGAQVIIADVQASNGVIHVIDAVLMPKTTSAAAGQ